MMDLDVMLYVDNYDDTDYFSLLHVKLVKS